MDGYRDAAGIMRAASVTVALYAVGDLVATVARFVDRVPGGIGDQLTIGVLALFILCAILVCRWIYVASANAHALTPGELEIGPGWAVGWFFIPIANLFKPYQAMKETWRASHNVAGLLEEGESPLVHWWWGLWIACSVAGWVTLQMGGLSYEPLDGYYYFDLLACLLNLALCLVLIRLMQRLVHAQQVARQGGIFA